MLQPKEKILIDYLDDNLQRSESIQTDPWITGDKDMAEQWFYLHLALDTLQDAGIQQQVIRTRTEFEALSHYRSSHVEAGTVRTMFRYTLRVAACVLLLLGATAVYKYNAANSASFYSQYYAPYDLNTSRSDLPEDPIDQAFLDKKWIQVLAAFNAVPNKTNKTYFLDAMAHIELKQFPDAIADLSQIIRSNQLSGDTYFEDEAQYYLAMSWIANKHADKALPILKKIKADKNHEFNEKVSQMSQIDLKVIAFKDAK